MSRGSSKEIFTANQNVEGNKSIWPTLNERPTYQQQPPTAFDKLKKAKNRTAEAEGRRKAGLQYIQKRSVKRKSHDDTPRNARARGAK
ncbi:hypothetical protein AVEN_196527-1 [Araneus ventricosus]|uniref:Uncharacterized protein n=1 Tax=Araneus ventricosus TaxID=182803 RepID=A0A4Y2WJX1_ARAVE|nr:hypothetical protein AVEN_196527-1 [Araneus ventricosus]